MSPRASHLTTAISSRQGLPPLKPLLLHLRESSFCQGEQGSGVPPHDLGLKLSFGAVALDVNLMGPPWVCKMGMRRRARGEGVENIRMA